MRLTARLRCLVIGGVLTLRGAGVALAVLLAQTALCPLAQAAPVSNAFTYQGQLVKNGAPHSGTGDFIFRLYDAQAGGAQVGSDVGVAGVTVSGGLFTIDLDFGAVFTGTALWLDIQVKTPGDAVYTALTPRVALAAAPYAHYALNAAGGGGGGLALPYTGNVSVPGSHGFRVNNTAATGASIALYGVSSSTAVDAIGVAGFSSTGRGLQGNAATGIGVLGSATSGDGVRGTASTGRAMYGYSNNGPGVVGDSDTHSGVVGSHLQANAPGHGVLGQTTNVSSSGVYGTTTAGDGVTGFTSAAFKAGIVGVTNHAQGRGGYFRNDGGGTAVLAEATTATTVYAQSGSGLAVFGTSNSNDGVFGQSGGAGKSGIVGLSYSLTGQGGYFRNDAGGAAIFVDGAARVKTLQILGGSDLAEPFDVAAASGVGAGPGTVVVIDDESAGNLRVSDRAYDTRVAGVISGANDLAPGMVMRAEGDEHADGMHPVALTGRVWCKVDASHGAVKPGDLLTTSPTAGHAMKAIDAGRRDGAILGKAMTALESGRGLVLVLVNLQ